MHVNVAPSQLGTDGFLRTVTDLVARHRLRPGQLVLELTESSTVADLTAAQAVLTELRRAGVAVSLDDFGVGYSSLSRLTDIELDSVKIARSFLAQLDSDQRRAAFLRGLLRLARDISLPVIAEGVERPGQLAELRTSAARTRRATCSAGRRSPTPPRPGWACPARCPRPDPRGRRPILVRRRVRGLCCGWAGRRPAVEDIEVTHGNQRLRSVQDRHRAVQLAHGGPDEGRVAVRAGAARLRRTSTGCTPCAPSSSARSGSPGTATGRSRR